MIPSLAFVSIEYDEHLKVLFQLSEGFYKNDKWTNVVLATSSFFAHVLFYGHIF